MVQLKIKEIPIYAHWNRQQNRSSTNYINYNPNSGLAIVSEESSSNLVQPFPPISSAMSISSVGHQPSIDEYARNGMERDRSHGYASRTNPRAYTNLSNVSPGKTSHDSTPITEKRKSNSGTGTYSNNMKHDSNIVTLQFVPLVRSFPIAKSISIRFWECTKHLPCRHRYRSYAELLTLPALEQLSKCHQ